MEVVERNLTVLRTDDVSGPGPGRGLVHARSKVLRRTPIAHGMVLDLPSGVMIWGSDHRPDEVIHDPKRAHSDPQDTVTMNVHHHPDAHTQPADEPTVDGHHAAEGIPRVGHRSAADTGLEEMEPGEEEVLARAHEKADGRRPDGSILDRRGAEFGVAPDRQPGVKVTVHQGIEIGSGTNHQVTEHEVDRHSTAAALRVSDVVPSVEEISA